MQTDRANGKKPIELLYSLGLMGMLLILVIINTNKMNRMQQSTPKAIAILVMHLHWIEKGHSQLI